MPKKNPKGFRLNRDLKWQHQRVRFKVRSEAYAFVRLLRRLWGGETNVGYWCTDKIMVGVKKGTLGDQVRWFVVVDSVDYINLWLYLLIWRAAKAYAQSYPALLRLQKLELAVKRMLAQRGDDICWRDLYTELAGLVGITFVPELICDRTKMLANCQRFVDSIYDGGPYTPLYVEKVEP